MWRILAVVLLIWFVASLFPHSGPRITKRFSVEVATPQGVRTGTSVISSQNSRAPWWFPASGASATRIRGEAVAVDLGSGRVLFVPISTVTKMRRTSDSTGGSLRDLFYSKEVGPDGVVSELKYLNMLTFGSLSDPSSAQQVDPLNLAAAFGSGYTLISVRVEDTTEPVTLPNTERYKALFERLPEKYAFTQRL